MKSNRILLSCALLSSSLISQGQEWKTFADSAKYFVDFKDNISAIYYYQKAAESLPRDSIFSETRFLFLNTTGRLGLTVGDYETSVNSFNSAIEILSKKNLRETIRYAETKDFLGQAHFFSGDYDLAENVWKEELSLYEKLKGKESAEYARSINLLGTLYYQIGKYAEAEQSLIVAATLREKLFGKENGDYAQSINNLSNVYRDIGQYEKAEPLAIAAKEIRFRVLKQPHAQYAISCINLANLYRDLGQYDDAEALYLEGKSIRKELLGDKHPQYAQVCNILADLYVITGKHKDAEQLYLEAKAIREEKLSKEHIDYAQTCNNLANLYFDMTEYDKAEKLYLEAKNIWNAKLKKEDPAHAFNRTSLGKLYLKTGKLGEAEINLKEAKLLWETTMSKDHPNYTWTTNELAKLYWNQNRIAEADSMYSQTFTLQKNQLNKVFRFTNEKEKQQYLNNVKGSADEYLSFFSKEFVETHAGKAYTISLLDRNLILSSITRLRQNIYASKNPDIINEFEKWMNIRQELAAFYSRSTTQKNEYIAKLEDEANKLEKELSRKSTAFNEEQGSTLNWESIRNRLKDNEAAIEFVEFNYFNGKNWTDTIYYAALLIKKGYNVPRMIQLFEKKQLDSLLSTIPITNVSSLYRGGRVNDGPTTSYSTQLYKLVWQPLETHLKNISKIYFSPAGDLFRISFAAIPLSETKLLSDKYQLVQLNTTAAILDSKPSVLDNTGQLVLYGGINYDANPEALAKTVSSQVPNYNKTRSVRSGGSTTNFEYLQGTLTEVKELEKQAQTANVNTTVYSGMDATEESFKSLTTQNSPAILHVATHGFFYTEPGSDSSKKSENVFSGSRDPLMRSGLLFAGSNNTFKGKMPKELEDGILTAYEVSNMYLPKTRMVVLSACETARGDIQGSEGVYGLQRAFRMAGVQNLVMSLWEVPDKETAEFMQELYKNIFKKMSISDAFYKTQTTMKNRYRKDPDKWAAWVLVR